MLKGYVYTAHGTSKASECVQLSCVITKPLFIHLMELRKIIHFQQNVFIWSYIQRPNCQGVLHKFNSQACTQENHYKEHCFLVDE